VAAEALGHIAHGAAVWALRDGLGSAHQTVRIASILSLALLEGSGEAPLAAQARNALSAMAPADVPPLTEALVWRLPPEARDIAFGHALDADPGTAVATALSLLGRRSTAQSARDALRRIDALHPLIFQLTADTAADILPVLADIGNHLQCLLDDTGGPPEDGERLRAALGDIVTVLLNWYDPEAPDLAAIVVDGMRALGDGAIGVLARRLDHADAEERPYIVSLLHALPWQPQGAEEALNYWLASGEWDRLATLGPVAIEPLLAEFEGTDLGRRDGAARALTRLGWQPEERVTEYRLAIAVGRWDALPRRDAAARTLLLDALAQERRAARALPPERADERKSRRIAMVRALGRYPTGDGRDPSAAVRGLLAALRDDPLPEVRDEAACALGEKGPDAIPLIAEALSDQDGGRGEETRFRCDLIHLLAQRGAHARSALNLLRRLAADDSSPLVRDAARAAVVRIAGGGAPGADRGSRVAADAGAAPSVAVSLAPHAAADVGQALRAGGQATPEELALQLDSHDPAQVGRAIATLVSIGRAGGPVLPAMERALLTASLSGRRAAAQVLDRLGLRPQRPEALAAYHLADDDLAQCEALGAPARSVLREALPLLDWRSAGAVALSLVRLGEPLWSPAIGSVIDLLERVASLRDAHIDVTLRGDDRRPAVAREVTLAVSRDADRRAARDLLRALHAEALRRRR